MKKGLISIFLMLSIFMSLVMPSFASKTAIQISNAVYLGVVGYGIAEAGNKDNFQYRFSVDGEEVIYRVSNVNGYAINNVLAEGYIFDLTVESNTIIGINAAEPDVIGTVQSIGLSSITVSGNDVNITEDTKVYEILTKAGGAEVKTVSLETGRSVKVYGNPADAIYITFISDPYEAPISGVPGQRTLKNFLATAMEPVGTVLYIYGGSWDWQDLGSSNQATSIGLFHTWMDFFQSKDHTYTYRNNDNFAESYYPHKGYNEYYYAGMDCSGYVGWALYNVMNTQNSKDGYVMSSTKMARTFAEDYGYGTWTREFNSSSFKAGDIFSINGHVCICLGVCDDGSLVILHSTPSDSRSGNPGGGVQLSGIGENEDCHAYKLAKKYMECYYPAWSHRYPAVFKTYSSYTSLSNANAGKFSWNLNETGLLDPDGYKDKSAGEILKDLFGENTGEEIGNK